MSRKAEIRIIGEIFLVLKEASSLDCTEVEQLLKLLKNLQSGVKRVVIKLINKSTSLALECRQPLQYNPNIVNDSKKTSLNTSLVLTFWIIRYVVKIPKRERKIISHVVVNLVYRPALLETFAVSVSYVVTNWYPWLSTSLESFAPFVYSHAKQFTEWPEWSIVCMQLWMKGPF